MPACGGEVPVNVGSCVQYVIAQQNPPGAAQSVEIILRATPLLPAGSGDS